jgi:hypothetical protein
MKSFQNQNFEESIVVVSFPLGNFLSFVFHIYLITHATENVCMQAGRLYRIKSEWNSNCDG